MLPLLASAVMRIAQIAPLYESVPPQAYGGTERVVAYLTDALVEAGHDVTLYASGDSVTRARLVAACPRALRLDPGRPEPSSCQALQLEQVADDAANYDILHFHNEPLHFSLGRRLGWPSIHTLHSRSDVPELAALLRQLPGAPLVSISDAQRRPLPWANWQATIYHGLPPDLFRFQGVPDHEPYCLFLGRISPEKQVHHAVEIARLAGMPLKIAAKIDLQDRAYYENVARPLLTAPGVEYLGEIGGADKEALLRHARALLFPVNWPEPFGLVMIEALACGTPVIAYPHGSVREVITDGVTGFIVDGVAAAVSALARIDEIDRKRCRAVFDERFTVKAMTRDYLRLFGRVVTQDFEPAMGCV